MFHHCSTNRDELRCEVATELVAGQLSASIGAVTAAGTRAESVSRALAVYWDTVEADPGLHQVLYEITPAVLRDPRASEIARSQYRRYLDGLTLHYRLDRDGAAARSALDCFAIDFARHAVPVPAGP